MNTNKLLTTTLLGLIIATGCNATDTKGSTLTPEQKKEVEALIKDTLMKQPELIEASLRANMEKKEAEAREAAQKAVKTEHKALFEDAEDPIIGNQKGTISMVVFMDPYCGYCRKFQPVLHKAVKKHKDLRIIYKPIPIMGPESKKAAEEELSASYMGRFPDYHEAVYESSVKSRQDRMQLAEKNNIDIKALKEGIASHKVDKHLERNKQLAVKLGINGTPAFVINNQLHPGYVDEDHLDALIAEAKNPKGDKK